MSDAADVRLTLVRDILELVVRTPGIETVDAGSRLEFVDGEIASYLAYVVDHRLVSIPLDTNELRMYPTAKARDALTRIRALLDCFDGNDDLIV